MKSLVYKQTHWGDPDKTSLWGFTGCMGKVRGWPFEAVIGIGGWGKEPKSRGIDGRVTWIGIGPTKTGNRKKPLVTFKHFVRMDEDGIVLADEAPHLEAKFNAGGARNAMNFDPETQAEVDKLLAYAMSAKSKSKASAGKASRCPPKKRPGC